MSSLKRHDGELMIDHRASPGLSADEARAVGLPGINLQEGTDVRLATVGCNHCGGVWIVNPFRTRERGYCRKCDHYVCDLCLAVTKQPDYVHRTITDLTELVQSGRFTLSGSTTNPILVPAGVCHG